jgi:hypothetical protein
VEGVVLLTDCPRQNSLGTDDKVMIVGFPDGFFKYTTVGGSESTIHRYSYSVAVATAHAMNP